MKTVKKIFLLLVLSSATLMTAQNISSIDSNGQILYEREVEKYTTLIIVSEDLAYNSYDENVQIDKLIAEYFKRLTAKNFNVATLKEDKMSYALLSYRKKGMVYRFETTSKDEFLSLITVTSQGVQINEKYVYYKPLSDEKIRNFSKVALDQAKHRASLIASAANKKVGDVISLSSYREELKRGYYHANDLLEHYFRVSVKFQLL